MTIINGLDIGTINYQKNEIKLAIKNNDPIEERLNVIIVISNPCLYIRRYQLLQQFVQQLEKEETQINLVIVELLYENQKEFYITNSKNKNHLQLRTKTPLWHKENLINLGVALLPKDYKAFAWIDADIEFDSSTWVQDTLKILNGCKDIVQLFSHAVDMDKNENTLNLFTGFGYSYCKNKKYCTHGLDYWHPGFAWAMTRKAYEKVHGLYEMAILGSGDSVMALSLINKVEPAATNIKYHSDYNLHMKQWEEKAKTLRLGYVPGIIRHFYHGTKQNRRYTERWKILINHCFSPMKHLTMDSSGLIIPTHNMSHKFKQDILEYFQQRKEDE